MLKLEKGALTRSIQKVYGQRERSKICTEKLDRLARDLMIQETIIAGLRKHGFELMSVAEPDLMANDPTRILVRQMMGAVAQYEKSQIVLKVRGARMRKRAKKGDARVGSHMDSMKGKRRPCTVRRHFGLKA